jgi:hypothetical protein
MVTILYHTQKARNTMSKEYKSDDVAAAQVHIAFIREILETGDLPPPIKDAISSLLQLYLLNSKPCRADSDGADT